MISAPSAVRVDLGTADVDPVPRPGRRVRGPVTMLFVVAGIAIALALAQMNAFRNRPVDANELRELLVSVGGVQALTIATADGAFDMVTFDPDDNDRLLAVHRDSYGPAENQSKNQIWQVANNAVNQSVWTRNLRHDFAHHNADGSTTVWAHDGGNVGFAPRIATVLGRDGDVVGRFGPVYASRSVTVDGVVFALTGSPDYYSNTDTYDELVAIGADGQLRLSDGSQFGWISHAAPGELIAFPRDDGGRTVVWDVESLDQLPDHPLSGRTYRHAAVSGDGHVAVGVLFDGRLEQIDLDAGRVVETFGMVDPAPIDRPIEVDESGEIAITVDRRGDVAMWRIGADDPITVIDGDIAPSRWINEQRASKSAAAISPDARRIAVRIPANATTEVRWRIIETGVDEWRRRACPSAPEFCS